MPRVRKTFFPLQNHAKIGSPDGHTHVNFCVAKQSSPYLCPPPSATSEIIGNRPIDCPRDGSHLAREVKEQEEGVMGDAEW